MTAREEETTDKGRKGEYDIPEELKLARLCTIAQARSRGSNQSAPKATAPNRIPVCCYENMVKRQGAFERGQSSLRAMPLELCLPSYWSAGNKLKCAAHEEE